MVDTTQLLASSDDDCHCQSRYGPIGFNTLPFDCHIWDAHFLFHPDGWLLFWSTTSGSPL